MADGARAILYNGRWTDGYFSIAWDFNVQGGGRTFMVTQTVAESEHLLSGRYNDRILLLTYDVFLVRLPATD
jgi:hypothetical protein